MKRTTLTSVALIGAIATGLTVTAASANGPRHGPVQMDFATLDTNGDGQVTQAEMDALAAARFAEADSNGNGAVTAEELAAFAQAQITERMASRADRMITEFDQDNSGDLSAEEMTGRGPASSMFFGRLDANDDGTVTAEELSAMGQGRGVERMTNRTDRMIAAMDQDDSGDLSLEEMAARGPGAGMFFERFDADGDGAVSAEEFETATADRGDRRHPGGKHGPWWGDREGRDRDSDQG